MPNDSELKETKKRLKAAKTAALKAGKLLLSRKNFKVHSKGWHDFFTEMDVESEQVIVDYLSKRFPNDDFLGEERGGGGKAGVGLWIIDPIDGTNNFINDIPGYTISIAYRNSAGDLTVGVIYDPRHRELFWASRGEGAYLNKKRVHVSSTQNQDKAITIIFPHPRLRKDAPFFFDLMQKIFLKSMDMRNFGSAALHLAYVACGRVEAFIHPALQIYDIAAGLVILEEAGGRYSGLVEGENPLETGNLLASNGALHDWYLLQNKSVGV